MDKLVARYAAWGFKRVSHRKDPRLKEQQLRSQKWVQSIAQGDEDNAETSLEWIVVHIYVLILLAVLLVGGIRFFYKKYRA